MEVAARDKKSLWTKKTPQRVRAGKSIGRRFPDALTAQLPRKPMGRVPRRQSLMWQWMQPCVRFNFPGLQCLFKHSSTTHHRHGNHTAVSGAKYYMPEDLANMMSLGASKLEVEKKRRLIYPLVMEPQTARKMSRMNTNNKNLSILSTTKCNAEVK